MIDIDDAFRAYREEIEPLGTREVPLRRGLGRVLSAPASSSVDLPPFPQSSMDGYALVSADTEGASTDAPARMELAGTVPAGRLEETPVLEAGRAMRIYTGAHLPEGADAVLRQEDALVEGGELLVHRPVAEGTAVRPRGDDLRRGTGLAEAGERLTPGHLAALAAGGVGRVRVRRRPSVALVLTGDEVVPADAELAPGQVHEADGPLVAGWLEAGGWGRPEDVHVGDTLEETEEALRTALETADLVLTTGGVSVGDRDHVAEAAERAGVRTVFWRVAQKPGKPLLFGLRDGTVLLGLPGNPGSVHACLVTHVRRALEHLEGAADPAPRPRPGTLAAPFRPDPRREWWARCRLEVVREGVLLHPQRGQASHMVADLGRCHALARIPRGEAALEPGASVSWVPAAGLPPYS